MLSRIMNNHSQVYALPELHYFERYHASERADSSKQIEAAIYLLRIINKGFFDQTTDEEFLPLASALIQAHAPDSYGGVYRLILEYTAREKGKAVLCEQTPQNIFYQEQIYSIFPDARFIHIVRDPRDVLLSQKRKWRRASQGATFIPMKETIRAYFNYHPYTISRIWKSVVSRAFITKLNTIRYEDLILNPNHILPIICSECKLDYEKGMELVPITGSSSAKDSQELGMNHSRIAAWERGGLNSAELFISNAVVKNQAKELGYVFKKTFPNPLLLLTYILYFPIQIAVAIMLNLGRQKNMISAIKRRLR